MKKILLTCSLLFATHALAQTPELDNLSEEDLKGVITDLSAVLTHVSVSPASSLGDVFGFEFGIIAGTVDTPGLDKVTKATDPSQEFESAPHATLYGALSFPMGITAELNLVPEIETEDMDFKSTSLGVKWTFSKLLSTPVDMAVRVSKSSAETRFVQDNPVPDTTIEFETDTTELMFLVSKNFVIFEPYLGFGHAKADGKINATANIFNFTGNQSATGDESGTHYVVGANFNLLFLKLGLEVGKIWDAQKISAKASFYF
jgi:hypothetical protein